MKTDGSFAALVISSTDTKIICLLTLPPAGKVLMLNTS